MTIRRDELPPHIYVQFYKDGTRKYTNQKMFFSEIHVLRFSQIILTGDKVKLF